MKKYVVALTLVCSQIAFAGETSCQISYFGEILNVLNWDNVDLQNGPETKVTRANAKEVLATATRTQNGILIDLKYSQDDVCDSCKLPSVLVTYESSASTYFSVNGIDVLKLFCQIKQD